MDVRSARRRRAGAAADNCHCANGHRAVCRRAPLAWTVLLLPVVVRLMRSGRRRSRWSLPLLFAVWANLHAGFIAGLAVVAWHLLPRTRDRTLIWQLLLSIAATLLNPYGPRLYVEIFRTLTDSSLHSHIGE